MDTQTSLTTLLSTYPDLTPAIIEDFVQRMDPDYFKQFSVRTIGDHLRLASILSPDHPCAVSIQPKRHGTYQLTFVAYDYFSEFATICGVLSAFGLDIREAFIFTYTDQTSQITETNKRKLKGVGRRWPSTHPLHPPGLSRKKVVDVFLLKVLKGFDFGAEDQIRLTAELTTMIALLETRHVGDVRNRVNRQLMETLGKLKTNFSDFIHPVHIKFINDHAAGETVVDIRSTDTPAFLYTFANALTMRGVYIAKAQIEVEGKTVRNQFFVRGRHGQKIEGRAEQQELKMTAALIKEFTHFLTWAPDPAKALDHFDQFLDQLLEDQSQMSELSVFTKKSLLVHLAQLFGTSDFLWEDFLRRQHSNLLPILEEFQKGPVVRPKADLAKTLQSELRKIKDPGDRKARLNQFKDQELFRIDMKHLLENTPLPDFSLALTNLAEVILNQALTEAQAVVRRVHKPPLSAGGRPYSFCICGLGKLGGRELGYASDIEVMFVYNIAKKTSTKNRVSPSEYFERLVQEFLRWIEAKQEGIFHIDTRLRPHGEKGLLANSLEEIRSYYGPKGPAAPFERQALIKLRYVAGDASLGSLVEEHRDKFVYSGESWPMDTALGLRKRQTNELVPPGTIHVKYSPGGLIDLEYTMQYFQLMHGDQIKELQTPNTLQALEALKTKGILSQGEAQVLQEDYLFQRQLIDALRIVRGNAQDLVLPASGSDGMIFLARRLGFITGDWQAGAAALERDIKRRMSRTQQFFRKRFGSQRRKSSLG